MTGIRVVVADDEPRLLRSITMLIDDDPEMTVVAAVGDGLAACEAAERLVPDVMLLDVRMPRMDGIEATRRLAASGDRPRIVVLTMFDDDDHVVRALRAGASGFLLKNVPPAQILHAIRVAHAGDALVVPEAMRRLLDDRVPRRSTPPRGWETLTARELEVLACIGRGQSNAEIATTLFVTPTTARTYVNRVLTKLAARDRAQLVVLAYETGLVSPGAL